MPFTPEEVLVTTWFAGTSALGAIIWSVWVVISDRRGVSQGDRTRARMVAREVGPVPPGGHVTFDAGIFTNTQIQVKLAEPVDKPTVWDRLRDDA